MADPPKDDDDKLVPRSPTVNPSTPTTSISDVDPSIIRDFIEVTKRDLELRQQELDIQRQAKADAHEYAKLALQAQARDRTDERGYKQRSRRDKMVFAVCGIVLLGAFLLITLKMGYERIAFEVVKDLGLLIERVGQTVYVRLARRAQQGLSHASRALQLYFPLP